MGASGRLGSDWPHKAERGFASTSLDTSMFSKSV